MPPRVISGKKPNDLKKTLKRLFAYMGNHKFVLLVVSVLVIINGALDLLGTYMIKPIVNNYIATGDTEGLFKAIIFMIVIYAVAVLSALGYSQIMVRVAQMMIKEIRRDLFKALEKLPIRYFDEHSHGDIMSNFTNDIDTLSECFNNSFSMMIKSFIELFGTIVLIFVLNWQLSLIVVFFYVILFFYIEYSSKKSKYYYKFQQDHLGALNGHIKESISGQKVIKVFDHEKANIEAFEKKNEDLRKAATSALSYSGTQVPFVVSISYINYAIVAVVGGIMAVRGMTDIGSLASYLIFVRQSSMPINRFTNQTNFILAALSGAERIFDVMDSESEIDDGKVTVAKTDEGWVFKDNGKSVPLKGEVRFEHVDFGYDHKAMVLKDLSLYAKPGQKIAFVGSTGAGKTTITSLLDRFYEIDNGKITFDGIDIRDIRKADLRKTLGVVLQDTHLFTGTIADNIRFGKPEATMEEVIEAAKVANAHSFIRRLPKGYDTYITSDGASLSQGQRQLLAIARAAIADPPVLILDEATSSIDTRTEKLIEKAMDKLMEGRTVFVIAHRLSTVRNSNAIMVLADGKIIERGDHDDLIAQKGTYYKLYMGMFELS